jgi:hypothetical protein
MGGREAYLVRPASIVLVIVASLAGAALVTAAAPANVRVTDATHPANEVSLAVNPTDATNVVAVAKDYSGGTTNACVVHNVWMGVYSSHDGGATWSDIVVPRTGPLASYGCSSDPIATFGPTGTLYLCGLALGNSAAAVWVATSNDGGKSIAQVSVAYVGYGSGSLDKDACEVDPTTGIVYDAYVDFNKNGQISVVAGLPLPTGGYEWLSPVSTGGYGSDPMISILPHGDVEVAWINAIGGSAIESATSPITGQLFGAPSLVATNIEGVSGVPNANFRAFTIPNSAVDASGRIYVVWHALDGASTDVFFTESSSGGAAPWTAPRLVNSVTTGDQIMPDISVVPDGSRIAVAYYDRSYDPANTLLSVTLSTSTDGGSTWSAQRVDPGTFNGDYGYHQNGFSFIGDYIGVATTPQGTHVAWADTRDYAAPMTGSAVYDAFVPS